MRGFCSLLLLLAAAACEPEATIDAGPGDAAASRCPIQVIQSQPCDIEQLECRSADDLYCVCMGARWQCDRCPFEVEPGRQCEVDQLECLSSEDELDCVCMGGTWRCDQ